MQQCRLLLTATAAVVLAAITSTTTVAPPPAFAQPSPAADASDPFAAFTREWRDDPIWHDGKAEIARYDATRTIYGKPRQYTLTLMTNRELADPQTKTKATHDDPQRAREVFKHHAREDIATDAYNYHFSTMCYVGASDLKSLKLDMGSQEACGATFKQYVNHAGELEWHQFSYHPGEGHRTGRQSPGRSYAFEDALSLVLRGYPFDSRPTLELQLLPDQTTNKLSPSEPLRAYVQYVGEETLELPIGRTPAHHLRVYFDEQEPGVVRLGLVKPMHYWFAADGSAPMLHAMVQYEGPDGVTYRLGELERDAYWERE